jgi:hypothetical protein
MTAAEWAGADADLLLCGHVCNEQRWRDLSALGQRGHVLDAVIHVELLRRGGTIVGPPWKKWADDFGTTTGALHVAARRLAAEKILWWGYERGRVTLTLRKGSK